MADGTVGLVVSCGVVAVQAVQRRQYKHTDNESYHYQTGDKAFHINFAYSKCAAARSQEESVVEFSKGCKTKK